MTLKPELDYAVQDKYLKHLKPLFAPLSSAEIEKRWGEEYAIGLAFAKKLDLFQAISSFKRADILIPETLMTRKAEIQYQIINCYYLAKRFEDVIETFEESLLAGTDRNFVAFHDLLIILFESYLKCEQPERSEWILHTMKKFYPTDAKKLALSLAIAQADFPSLRELSDDPTPQKELASLEEKRFQQDNGSILLVSSEDSLFNEDETLQYSRLKEYTECQNSVKEITSAYQKYKKSPFLAGALNALIPGSGYLYLGQKQSAFTAFCLNSLFIGSAAYFYKSGNLPAAIVTSSFEMGWYLGGIKGAKEGALLYNNRLFETHAHHHMRDQKLYPILMLSHGF